MIVRSTRVITANGVEPVSVRMSGGVITGLDPHDTRTTDPHIIDAGDDVVMAGIVDTHVHVNEPGRTEWEGFASATRAAAAGGVTTLFDMPLNSIPATTTPAALAAKRAAARQHLTVNVGFIGGVVPGNADQLAALYAEGIRLFKCFLVPSGVEEFPCVTEADLRIAMPVLAKLDATLMVHAELPEHINPIPSGDPRAYATYLASRPPVAETAAAHLVIRLAEEFGTRVHIVHVSSPETLDHVDAARRNGVRISAETCPHYLAFSADEIPDGATQFKCAPPIRDAAARDALWAAVLDGRLSMIASDHSPCPPELKKLEEGDFFAAWGGIASLQLGLPAVWHGARQRGASVDLIAKRMCEATADLAGIGKRKGRLGVGHDADIVIWSPEASVEVNAIELLHRHQLTPYRDRTLTGAVRTTIIGGEIVFQNGSIVRSDAGRLVP